MNVSETIRRLKRVIVTSQEDVFRYPHTTVPPQRRLPRLDSLNVLYPCPPELLATAELWSGEVERGALQGHLRAGDGLALIMDRHRIVSHALVRRSGFLYLDANYRALRLPPDTIYIHCCATNPDYRGHGLYPHLLRHVISHERTKNPHTDIWIATARTNTASIKGIRKAGFNLEYRGWTLGILGGRIGWTRKRRPAAPARSIDDTDHNPETMPTGRV